MSEPLMELVRRAQNLDKEAFGALYELYVDAVYRYVYYRLFNKQEAEDVTEEIFIKAMLGIEGYDEDKGHFTNWLYGIARNAVIDHFRESSRRALAMQNMKAQEPVSLRDEPDAFVAEVVKRALSGLTDEQREVIVLRYFAGLKISEIAAHMGKPETAVKALQRRASIALAKALGGEQGEK